MEIRLRFVQTKCTEYQFIPKTILTEGYGHVVFIDTIVTSVVHFETISLVEKIVVDVEPATPIIIVYSLCSIIVGNDKVATNGSR